MDESTAQWLIVAAEHHRQGRLAEAERIYRQVLSRDPRNARALHLLGFVAHQVGRNEDAESLMRQALAIDSSAPDFHGNYGAVLLAMNRPADGVIALRRAVQLAPNLA